MDEALAFWIHYGRWASQRLDLLLAERGALMKGLDQIRAASDDPDSVQQIVDHLLGEQTRMEQEASFIPAG